MQTLIIVTVLVAACSATAILPSPIYSGIQATYPVAYPQVAYPQVAYHTSKVVVSKPAIKYVYPAASAPLTLPLVQSHQYLQAPVQSHQYLQAPVQSHHYLQAPVQSHHYLQSPVYSHLGYYPYLHAPSPVLAGATLVKPVQEVKDKQE